MLAAAVSQQGRHEEALQICAQERADWARLEFLAIIYRRVGHFVESERALNELLDLELKRNDFSSHAFQIAAVYADRGDADHAFEWMEIGYVKRDSGNGLLKISRFFRSLHTDPRWPIIMKKMGFAD